MSRKVLIIGASSTLGFATAKVLAQDSTSLWLTYRSPGKDTLLQGIAPGVRISQLDVTLPDQLAVLRGQVEETWESVDSIMVACGVGLLQPITSWKAGQPLFNVNVESLLEIARSFFGLLARGTAPSMLFLSSNMALAGAAGMTAYAATKGAIASLTRALAIEWAPRGIRVNSLAPGIVPSPMVEAMFANLSDIQRQAIAARHPLGFGEPNDVAFAARFLLSPEAKWITGVVLPVDGGYTAQ